ncbi:2'-5' RNA ligase family protein [Jatrophihabitans sp. YIM 134969]
MDPLVVTLVLDPDATARFDELRSELFPAGRTAVGAHLTLFHAVPGEQWPTVEADLERCARRGPFPLRVSEVVPLGRGAAFCLESSELEAVHRTLQRSWRDTLTKQDQQGLRAHVTVQNKVTPEQARSTVQRLRAGFAPYEVTALGLAAWRYVGGPWEPLREFHFAGGHG